MTGPVSSRGLAPYLPLTVFVERTKKQINESMRRNRINVPPPTGQANTQDAMALGGNRMSCSRSLREGWDEDSCADYLPVQRAVSSESLGKCPGHKTADGGRRSPRSSPSIKGAKRAYL